MYGLTLFPQVSTEMLSMQVQKSQGTVWCVYVDKAAMPVTRVTAIARPADSSAIETSECRTVDSDELLHQTN